MKLPTDITIFQPVITARYVAQCPTGIAPYGAYDCLGLVGRNTRRALRHLTKWLACWQQLIITLILTTICHTSFAHELMVFAWVDGDTVVAEGKFSSGGKPQQGKVRVYDGEDKLLRILDVQQDGTAHFPLKDYANGLKVKMDVGDGHESYWILTPQDIDNQRQQKTAD